MLLVYGVLVVLAQILLVDSLLNCSYVKQLVKGVKEEGTLLQRKSNQLSRWESLKIVVWMLLRPGVPNYEVCDVKHREVGQKIVIIDLQIVKEALITVVDLSMAKQIMSSNQWISRFRDSYYMFKCTFSKPYGLLFGGGEYWRTARTLSLKILHQLKFYKQENLERLINVEVDEALGGIDKKIKEGGGEATFSPHQMFEVHALNLVSQVGWSERFSNSDFFMTDIIGAGNVMNRTFNVGFGVLEVFPWLRHLPDLTFYGAYKRANDIIVDYFKNVVAERRRSGTYKIDPTDFTDYFLLEVDKEENPAVINDEAYCIAMRDLVWAGTDTTNTALEHGILQMSLRPEVQQRVQAEIHEVLGVRRPPTYASRTSMPYTQAVLLEILRYSVPVPMTSRSAVVDTNLGGDRVPKGSLCGINLYAIHRSEDVWIDPYEFRPERFLGPAGEIINADKIIPFGFGKRVCIGESVARTFLFIAFVSLMQRYSFQISSKHPPPSFKNLFGISRCPVPYFVTVRQRHCCSSEGPAGSSACLL